MYKTKIIEIGPIVEDFAEEFLLVLFGPQAMAELRDICVIHESSEEPKRRNPEERTVDYWRTGISYS